MLLSHQTGDRKPCRWCELRNSHHHLELKAAFNVKQVLLIAAMKPAIIYVMEQVPFKDAMASYFSRIGRKGGKIGGKRKFPGKTEAANHARSIPTPCPICGEEQASQRQASAHCLGKPVPRSWRD